MILSSHEKEHIPRSFSSVVLNKSLLVFVPNFDLSVHPFTDIWADSIFLCFCFCFFIREFGKYIAGKSTRNKQPVAKKWGIDIKYD